MVCHAVGIMTTEVLVEDVFEQYYSYVRYAAYHDTNDKPIWESMQDREAFEEKWFRQEGIEVVRSVKDGKTIGRLVFKDREEFIIWMMRWS